MKRDLTLYIVGAVAIVVVVFLAVWLGSAIGSDCDLVRHIVGDC